MISVVEATASIHSPQLRLALSPEQVSQQPPNRSICFVKWLFAPLVWSLDFLPKLKTTFCVPGT